MEKQYKVPTRQVHLDFHTSPNIPSIGSNFSKENFQAALKTGNLESITVFAKCHHGYCYYPTQVGTQHPGLDFDLTGAMVEAAHEIGVRAPIYIPMGWSHLDAQTHPQWLSYDQEGNVKATKSFKAITGPDDPMGNLSWQLLCLNEGPYLQHVYDLTEEICKRYPVLDGMFYDICFNSKSCFCDTCKEGMRKRGMNPDSVEDAEAYYRENRIAFMDKCMEIVHTYHPDATVFFNGSADIVQPEYHSHETHFELEDLPTAWGGYDKFPLRAKFFRNTGKAYLGMTGKFHLDWGEFGGYKTKEALKYEIAMMAMYGAGASVGDHMHPDGFMEMQTYETIGYAYDYMEKLIPYCQGTPVTGLGICISEDSATNEGLSRILMESRVDFDIISQGNFHKYQAVIIPEKPMLSHKDVEALRAYLSAGGKVLLMADALVQDGKFMVDTGLDYLEKPRFDCDYIQSLEEDSRLPKAALLCYNPGHHTRCRDARVLAEMLQPYFNRTFNHFCGHKNTPQDKNAERCPAIAQKGNVLYMAHNLPQQYFQKGALYHKYYFNYALEKLYECPVKAQGLGAQGRCVVIHQEEENRYCFHMTYACPVKRGVAEVIEDVLPVYNIACTLKTDKKVQKVSLPLENAELPFTQEKDGVSFTLPKLQCHSLVVLKY